ncbi:MAG: PE-PPE domain-containing protein [Mycobacterium sp.]
MTATRFRSLGAVLLAIVCAAVLGVTSILTSAFVFGVEKVLADWAQIKLLADEGWIMSGTGAPTPSEGYIDQVLGLYLQPSEPFTGQQPTFDGYNFQGLSTPEQFCPFVCVGPVPPGDISPSYLPNPPVDPNDFPTSLTFGSSLTTGAGLMNFVVKPELIAGDNVAAFGYSQSGTVATVAMNNLLEQAQAGTAGWPTANELQNLHVALIGDPNNPIGGILDRLQFPDGIEPFSLTPAPQHVPFVNIPLSIAPTPTSGFGDGAIYTGEYDGWASFPQDPTNLLALINALIGIITVHPFYPLYTPDQLADAIDVGTIGDTNFYDIPENLPILQFMYNGSSTAGQFFGDFFSPWARLIIDWAYGNAGDPGDALTPTPAGGSAVDGLYAIPTAEVTNGANIAGSPYEASVGVAGGPWAATPFGDLYDGSALTSVADAGIAGIFMKMDPLQLIAGVQNALIQSLVGPWADVAAGNSATLPGGTLGVVNDITEALRFITGYDLVNGLDQLLLTGLDDLGAKDLVNGLLDGPLIPGQPIIDLVGVGFDIFNFFGA